MQAAKEDCFEVDIAVPGLFIAHSMTNFLPLIEYVVPFEVGQCTVVRVRSSISRNASFDPFTMRCIGFSRRTGGPVEPLFEIEPVLVVGGV